MNTDVQNIITKKSFLFISIVILLMLIFLFIISQGLLWYIVNIFLYISLLVNLWLVYFKFKNNTKTQSQNVIKKQILAIILGLMLVAGYILFMFTTPFIKGTLNENYLQNVVYEITREKIDDYDKVNSILSWFDRNSDNMYKYIWLCNYL